MAIEDGLLIGSRREIEAWFAATGQTQRELWAIIFKKTSGKQSVTIGELIESGLCWGWVDHQTKRIDDERYGIRFVPRRPGSNWSARNRATACRLIAAGRMTPAGAVQLPPDLVCHDV